MAIKMLRPGTRHGNKVWYARISVKGCRVEKSTYTSNARLARRYAEGIERGMYERHALGGSPRTVAQAIDGYIRFRRPRPRDEGYLMVLRAALGHRECAAITQEDFDACAAVLYPRCSNATRNRGVYTPLQAVLRHSGVHATIKRPKQPRPKHRSLTAAQRDILIRNAVDPELKALLTLLFYAGPRISEAIALTRDRTDLANALACFETTKTDDEHWRPLHKKVVFALAQLPARQDGRFFRWKTRAGPRKLIAALSRQTQIPFSPHRARHTFADLMMEKGASLRDLMDAGGWSNERSAMRYTTKRVERARKAVDRLECTSQR